MSGVRGDARKRQQGEHLTHWDAGVRAVIEREVAKERERIAEAIEAIAPHAPRTITPQTAGAQATRSALLTAARIAREAGQS